MVALHAFVSLVAGFAGMMMVTLGLRGLMLWLAPSLAKIQARPTLGYTVVNVGASFLAGAAGGYVTAYLAKGNSLVQVLALAIVVLVLAALSALQGRGQQPIWYQLAQVALSPVGVFVGGMVRLKVMGIL